MIATFLMTWKEIWRKRMLLVTFLLTLLFLGLYSYALSLVHPSNNNNSLINNYMQGMVFLSAGLYFANFVVAFLVIFSSVGTVSSEIENGILLAVLPRPVHRWEIFCGKWLGFLGWGVLYAALLFVSICVIVHIQLNFPLDTRSLFRAFGLFLMIPLVLSSLSILGSVYMPTLGNGILMAMLYCLGLLGGLLEQVMSMDVHLAKGMSTVGMVTSMLIPTDSIYRRMTFELIGGSDLPIGPETMRMLGPFASSVVPSPAFIWYSVAYVLVLLIWGAIRFQKRDI